MNKKKIVLIIAVTVLAGVTTFLVGWRVAGLFNQTEDNNAKVEKPINGALDSGNYKPKPTAPPSGSGGVEPTPDNDRDAGNSLQSRDILSSVEPVWEATEPAVLNGDHCWRDDNGDGRRRRCDNLIINQGFDPNGAIPAVSNWITETVLDTDRRGISSSRSLHLSGQNNGAVNDEYNSNIQPLYSPGRYQFSFWVKEDQSSANTNEWEVRFKLRDWWSTEGMPSGVKHCYGNFHRIHRLTPAIGEWRRYSFDFEVPLVENGWDVPFTPLEIGCFDASGNRIEPYDKTIIMPGGYAIVVSGNVGGEMSGNVWFDDFGLVKIE